MKNLLISCTLVLFALCGMAQTVDSSQVGKIVYYEGVVELGVGSSWRKAKINAVVKKHQAIRTVGDGIAEITWNNGVKSFVGPNSNLSVKALMNGSSSNAKAQTEGSFNNFKSIFTTSDAKKRSQEGGIRRSETEVRSKPAKDEIYWKEDAEVFFNDGYELYEAGKYSAAITRIEAFISQKPQDEMIQYAYFVLGHSYILSNNTVKAKEIFDRFLIEFPNNELKSEAEKVLAQLAD